MSTPELPLPLPPKTKIRRYFLGLLVAGLTVYFVLPRFSALEHSLRTVSTLNTGFLALAFGAQLLSYLTCGYRLKSIVRVATRPISILDGALITAAANSIGTLGGGVFGTAGMTYLWLRQRGVNPGAAGLGGWLPIFLTNFTLAIVTLLGLLVMIVLNKSSGVLDAGFTLAVLIIAAALAVLIWSLIHREKLGRIALQLATWAGKIRRKKPDLLNTEASVRHLLESWDALVQGGWPRPLLGSVLNTGFDMLSLWCLFAATGHRVGPEVLVAGYGVPQLLGKLTVVLGGVGIVETSMVALYAILGIPKTAAVIAVLGYRLVSFWLPTIGGIALVPFLEHWKERPVKV
jgi:uncharacterized protein (TIRG00374 family)